MFASLLSLLFGCSHRNTTFPITIRSGKSLRNLAGPSDTYIVCLDCGREFPYSWEQMRILPATAKAPTAVGEQVGSFSVTK